MAKTKFKDNEILQAMEYHNDRDAVVFGANGRYGLGAYYDITKVSSVFGDKDYNSQDNIDKAENSEAAKAYDESIDENLRAALWLKW